MGESETDGDVQAGRFYVKAIASYEAALQRDPQSFDAAYNRYHYSPDQIHQVRGMGTALKARQGEIAVSTWAKPVVVAGALRPIFEIAS
jgi:hypothetical protein